MVKKGTLHEQAAVFVEQELTKMVATYFAVLFLMVFTPCPGVIALALGAVLMALRFSWAGGWYYDDYRLDGQTAIVTGSTAGIGAEVAYELYRRGATVIMACRNLRKAEQVAYQIENTTNANTQTIDMIELDLTSFDSVHKFVQQYKAKYDKLDILINNAGIMWHPHSITRDGVEKTLQVNHVSPFLLTNLLLDLLKKSPQGRIVNLASFASYFTSVLDFSNLNGEKSWDGGMHYCNTKLLNIMHVAELSRRLKGTRVTANSNCPGYVFTDLISHINSIGWRKLHKLNLLWMTHKSAFQGAQTTIMLATDPIYGRISGRYFSDCLEAEPNRLARDEALLEKAWKYTEELCTKNANSAAVKNSENGKTK